METTCPYTKVPKKATRAHGDIVSFLMTVRSDVNDFAWSEGFVIKVESSGDKHTGRQSVFISIFST